MKNIPQEQLDKLQGQEFQVEEPEDDLVKPEGQDEGEQNQQDKEKVSSSTDEEVVADKARIPYSRFEKVNERAIRAEERARLLEEQLQSRSVDRPVQKEEEVPAEWLEVLGDSPASKRAYQLILGLNERHQQEAIEKFQSDLYAQQREESTAVERNLESIEDGLAQFQERLGRNLSEEEESSLLDIQDEFTAKDQDGNYVAPLLSPSQAYEILQLREGTAKAKTNQARKRVVSLTGANTEGDVSSNSGEYNPLAWGAWRDKL